MFTFDSRRGPPSVSRISGQVAAAVTALDVDLAVQQRRRRRIPPRAIHGCCRESACCRVLKTLLLLLPVLVVAPLT